MKYLLDTNILLWWLNDDKKLKASARKIIQARENQILISVVNGIEISIKNRLGKLPLRTTLNKIFQASNFDILNIDVNHLLLFDRLPPHPKHKDPFDRILISQAKTENLTLITSDPKIWKYKISLLKA